ncbi:hypothetical protein predicted by Glimmer/Critica [Sorangium cellulosum So ce56]|uniref:Uncharacterized protein n=1 Tax=Sorangium cellulosum (strain So ce56) TaxID=448385 RepID=A9EPU7_SORC5|nr:hypothetical protein predicted by Glimmer/Critica [Sorangium cellulosum So ce56]
MVCRGPRSPEQAISPCAEQAEPPFGATIAKIATYIVSLCMQICKRRYSRSVIFAGEELGNARAAPLVMEDDERLVRDASVVDLDGDPSTLAAAGFSSRRRPGRARARATPWSPPASRPPTPRSRPRRGERET